MMTTEEFIKDRYDFNSEQLEEIRDRMSTLPRINFDNIPDLMVSFAQYHVKEALITSHKNNQLPIEDLNFTLSCYPLTNIK